MAKVKIQGHASGTGVLTVTAPNTSTDRTITLPDSTGTLVDDTTAVTKDANGNVGIGVTPKTWDSRKALQIGGNGTLAGSASAGAGGYLQLLQNAYTDGTWKYISTDEAARLRSQDGQWNFDVAASGSADSAISWATKVTIDNDGLKFGTDTASANALDDYEEGTHQYTITGSTGGSMTPRSGYQYLSYTKIGRQVTVIGKFETSGTHNATGFLRWSLPFAIGNFTDQAENPAGSIFLYRAGLANVYNPTLVAWAGISYFGVYYNNISNNEVTTLDGGNVDSTIEGYISFTYFTA